MRGRMMPRRDQRSPHEPFGVEVDELIIMRAYSSTSGFKTREDRPQICAVLGAKWDCPTVPPLPAVLKPALGITRVMSTAVNRNSDFAGYRVRQHSLPALR